MFIVFEPLQIGLKLSKYVARYENQYYFSRYDVKYTPQNPKSLLEMKYLHTIFQFLSIQKFLSFVQPFGNDGYIEMLHGGSIPHFIQYV